jgi:hypothetical protein
MQHAEASKLVEEHERALDVLCSQSQCVVTKARTKKKLHPRTHTLRRSLALSAPPVSFFFRFFFRSTLDPCADT